MAQFNYSTYEASQQKPKTTGGSIGYFSLKNDGDEAIVRFAVGSPDDVTFASVHSVKATGNRWLKVSCLHDSNSASKDDCPFCNAGQKVLYKAYIKVITYEKQADGSFMPVPKIWERPAKFVEDLKSKLIDYGDLHNVLFKVRRNGQAGSMDTTYSINYAAPAVYKQELFPADFSVFNNYDPTKHDYWVKTKEDMAYYLEHNEFPAVNKTSYGANEAAKALIGSPEEAKAIDDALGFKSEEVVTSGTAFSGRPTSPQTRDTGFSVGPSEDRPRRTYPNY